MSEIRWKECSITILDEYIDLSLLTKRKDHVWKSGTIFNVGVSDYRVERRFLKLFLESSY